MTSSLKPPKLSFIETTSITNFMGAGGLHIICLMILGRITPFVSTSISSRLYLISKFFTVSID
jgi:hypothetical protein